MADQCPAALHGTTMHAHLQVGQDSAYRFGMVTDRFNVPWMIKHSRPMPNG